MSHTTEESNSSEREKSRVKKKRKTKPKRKVVESESEVDFDKSEVVELRQMSDYHNPMIMKYFEALDVGYRPSRIQHDTVDIPEDLDVFKELDNPPLGWDELFLEYRSTLIKICDLLSREGDYYPPKKKVFAAYHKTPLDKVRVVIIGQDPYPQAGYAMGLSFSVPKGMPVPASLKNIYEEVSNSYVYFDPPGHGDLSKWCKSGVMLLNSCLTVKPGEPESHVKKNIWKPFMVQTIRAICAQNPNAIFVMWGKKSQGLIGEISDRNPILTAGNPSSRNQTGGFLNCGHFVEINRLLLKTDRDLLEKALKKGFYKDIKEKWDSGEGLFSGVYYYIERCQFRALYNIMAKSEDGKKLKKLEGYEEIVDFFKNCAKKEIDWSL